MNSVVLPAPWRLQDFEKKLLLQEVESLTGAAAAWNGSSVAIDRPLTRAEAKRLATRVALAAGVVDRDGYTWVTQQRSLEAAVSGGSRKVTTHALHGLHPYKGKFYPQLARSVMNSVALAKRSNVLDPFAGCGTTLLESELLGMSGFGLDTNPLAVLVGNTKLAALSAPADRLARSLESLSLSRSSQRLPAHDYLRAWFPQQNLDDLSRIMFAIHELPEGLSRAFALVVLSSVLRQCSLQDPTQLRVYRRKDPVDQIPRLAPAFREALSQSIEDVVSTQEALGGPLKRTNSEFKLGDARRIAASTRRKFDAAITSPPYANALPYIDTDRLSLIAFSMLGGRSQRELENELIGNREIGVKQQRLVEVEMRRSLESGNLAPLVEQTILHAIDGAEADGAGFRRKRTPALLFSYFDDMRRVLRGISRQVREDAPVVIVIGNSTFTSKDGGPVMIPTSDAFVEIGATLGLQLESRFSKRLTSYGATTTRHQRNAMAHEDVLVLRRSSN